MNAITTTLFLITSFLLIPTKAFSQTLEYSTSPVDFAVIRNFSSPDQLLVVNNLAASATLTLPTNRKAAPSPKPN